MSKPSRRRPARQSSGALSGIPYEHVQPGRAMQMLLGPPAVLSLLATQTHPEHANTLFVICGVLLVAMFLFSSLKTEVTGEHLRWRFGSGLIRKQVAIADIAGAAITRSRLIDGWGIHYTRRGWLYNVSGRDCVLVTLKDGKSFLLGSDDAVGLWEALEQRIAPDIRN